MRAIILAAGPGTRLLPHTESLPKCLLEVNGRNIIDMQLDALAACGITDVGIVVGHAKEKLLSHVRNRTDVSLTFIENAEYKTSNSAHSLSLARTYLEADTDGFLILNSDLIFVPELLNELLVSPVTDGIIINRKVTGSDMVNVRMEGDRILEMSKELPIDEAHAEAVGPVLLSKKGGASFLAQLSSERNNWVFYVLSTFAQTFPFHGVDAKNFPWAEVDTTEDLEAAKVIFENTNLM